jgi:hypothetical protein
MDVDFYTLERSVQDRFADATRSIGLPTPILREEPEDRGVALWLAAATALAAALVFLLLRGIGSLESELSIAPLPFAAIYAVAAGAVAYCVLRALALGNARSSIPYRPGLYLFPAGVFDARQEPIRVFLHPDLNGAALGPANDLRVTTRGGELVFRLPDAGVAGQALEAFERAREQYALAIQSDNRRELAMLDPLVDSGFSSPFSPQHRILRNDPVWAKWSLVVALVIGAVVGPSLWVSRNAVSAQRMYAAATLRNDAAGYRAYVARRGPRAEVAEVLLPRAELRQAMAAGTVEALEEFVASHPGSKIQGEVEGAVQAAVSAELEESAKAGTVTALREFSRRRARYAFIKPAVEARTVAIYKGLLTKFVPGRAPAVASFFERLLGYAKVHGPRVTIRFVRRLPDSVAAADSLVKLSAYFMGKQSIPSQYFVGDYAAKREATAGAELAKIIGEPFPKDVLAPELGPTVTDGAVPEPTEPTLLVEYAPEMAGGYMSPKPRGVFVGVGMTVKAAFRIPGDNQPLELKASLWRAPNPLILKNEGATVADVYEKMASDGISKFLKDFTALVGPAA